MKPAPGAAAGEKDCIVFVLRNVKPNILLIAVIAAIFASLCAPFALAAAPVTPAETFIQDNIAKGLAILSDKDVAHGQTAAKFRAFLETLTDVKRVAIYTLGPAAKTAAPADVDAFEAAFQDYATAVYQSQLAHYSGEGLAVTGSQQRAPGDFIVQTRVADADGRVSANADEVDFRVVAAGNGFSVLDASVSGVWIATDERDQFAAFLAQNNNSVPALTAHVKQVTANIQAK